MAGRVMCLVVCFALIAAACSSNDSTDDGPGSRDGDEQPSPDDETTIANATTTTLPLVQISLSLRSAPNRLVLDELPAGIDASTISVMTNGQTVTADIAADGSAVVRNVPGGAAEIVLIDGDGVPMYRAQEIDIVGEDESDTSMYESAELNPGFGYIETRDGTTLSANVVLPGSASNGPYPTLVEYSGYAPSDPGAEDPYRLLLPSLGYALVQVNVRGTGCSGGSFDAFERIQSLDGYDVIETVASQEWSSNVGMFGISYPGIMQLHVASTRPPSLAAIGALSVTDGVDSVLYPGGIYNDGFGENWTALVTDQAAAGGQAWTKQIIDDGDTECDNNQRLRQHNPDLVELIRSDGDLDETTTAELERLIAERSAETHAAEIDVPVFLAGAWQDEQTGGRFPSLLDELQNAPVLRAVMYNGLHVDAASGELLVQLVDFYNLYVAEEPPGLDPFTSVFVGVALGELFGEPLELPISEYNGLSVTDATKLYEEESSIRIQFDQGASRSNLPVSSFAVTADQWPLKEVVPTTLFLANGDQATDNLSPGGQFDLTSAEPDDATEATFKTNPDEGDVVTVESVDDIWTTQPNWNWPAADSDASVLATSNSLDEDMVLIGNLSADLWVSADAEDADLEVTVSEIAPDGSETYVQAGWLRVSQRALAEDATELRPKIASSVGQPQLLEPNSEPVLARVEVLPFAHVFRQDSRIRISIDTPGASRPQWRFDVADEPVEVTIHSSAEYPSKIVLPVVPGFDIPTDRPDCGTLRGQPCRRN